MRHTNQTALDPDVYAAARVRDFQLAVGAAIKPLLSGLPTDLDGAPDELKIAICVASQVRHALQALGVQL